MSREVQEKIYAGLIGMDAGMRLGAPVENPYWTYEELRDYYGDMRGYLRVHKNHTADDDVNGPMLLWRAVADGDASGNLTPEAAGEAWLNYTRFGRGMFWWGGEDVSTEHRAYMNLRRGVKPPESGSAALNGKVASEQIGGQIFADVWGLLCPGEPAKAAALARTAASVSHDGEGLHGAAFMAAAVAAAFAAGSVDEVIDKALSQIPEDSDYAHVMRAVRDFHAQHPAEEDFRAARDFVESDWGHDRFPGGWHIIPNAGICMVALLYGGGDFGRTIEIAVMSGFDTDCNASNVGTILGVLNGLDGLPPRYRDPINDTVILSGISGYLNMVDLPSLAKELFETACLLAKKDGADEATGANRGEADTTDLPANRGDAGAASPANRDGADTAFPANRGELHFDFELPGSTHGLKLSERCAHTIRNVDFEARSGSRSLELLIDGKHPHAADLCFNACFTREDLEDERYEPAFSPRAYPGQTVRCWMKSLQKAPAKVEVRPFVTCAMGGERIDLEPVLLKEGKWTEIAFEIPDLLGDQAHEIGWRFDVTPDEEPWVLGKVYIDDIIVAGPMDYSVDFSVQREEFGQITPFTFSDCRATVEGGALCLEAEEEPTATGCQAFTGNYYMEHERVEVAASAEGGGALILLRAEGARRYYAAGLLPGGRAGICRYENGEVTELGVIDFPWEEGREYLLIARADDTDLALTINGENLVTADDDHFAYGMIGVGQAGSGRSCWRDLRVQAD